MPGSRWSSGRRALKVWVVLAAPALRTGHVSTAVALECPIETCTPRAVACAASSAARAPRLSEAHALRRPRIGGRRRQYPVRAGARPAAPPSFHRRETGFRDESLPGSQPAACRTAAKRGEAGDRAQSSIERCGNGGRQVVSGIVPRRQGADSLERLRRGSHHVVLCGPVKVHIGESGVECSDGKLCTGIA